MFKKIYTFLFLTTIIIIMAFCTGCSSTSSDNNKIAYISSNTGSDYEKTFKELQLGTLFDFNLKLLNAEKSFVDIWVEGYSNGKAVEPFPLIRLSYGLAPAQTTEGRMGFGIINPNGDEPQFFLYSGGAKTEHSIDHNFFDKSAGSGWRYAIGKEPIGIEPGKEVILAEYRQNEGSFRSGYDYTDINSVNQMISENKTVLLLKIKVEEKEKE